MLIRVDRSVLQTNDALAAQNRSRAEASQTTLGLLSGTPGCGKTTLLQTTLAQESASLDGIRMLDAPTGAYDHWTAAQVREALDTYDLAEIGCLFIDDTGGRAGAGGIDLGEQKRVVLVSACEGDGAVAGNAPLLRTADLILITKVDRSDPGDHRIDRIRNDLAKVNAQAPVHELSAFSGEGMDDWLAWLETNVVGFASEPVCC